MISFLLNKEKNDTSFVVIHVLTLKKSYQLPEVFSQLHN